MKEKRTYPRRVAMYFRKDNLKVYERLEHLSQITGLSLSKVSSMALRYGVPELEKRIGGLVEPLKTSKAKIKSKK